MTDLESAYGTAFERVFGSFQLSCFFHIQQAVVKRLKRKFTAWNSTFAIFIETYIPLLARPANQICTNRLKLNMKSAGSSTNCRKQCLGSISMHCGNE